MRVHILRIWKEVLEIRRIPEPGGNSQGKGKGVWERLENSLRVNDLHTWSKDDPCILALCLLFYCRHGPLAVKPMDTNAFTHPIVLNIAQGSIFLIIYSLPVLCTPQNYTPHVPAIYKINLGPIKDSTPLLPSIPYGWATLLRYMIPISPFPWEFSLTSSPSWQCPSVISGKVHAVRDFLSHATCQSCTQIRHFVSYCHLLVLTLSLISPKIPRTHYNDFGL